MRTRESGMPEQAVWEAFFDPDRILTQVGLGPDDGDVVDVGCGYGTFTLAAARIVRGRVIALDIDDEMVQTTSTRARTEDLLNVHAARRDVVETGTGLTDGGAGTVLLFNNLHADSWPELLGEARRILRPGGRLAVIHWNFDPTTPRGPSMDIRLTPDECRRRAVAAGFDVPPPGFIDLPPYHFGLTVTRPSDAPT